MSDKKTSRSPWSAVCFPIPNYSAKSADCRYLSARMENCVVSKWLDKKSLLSINGLALTPETMTYLKYLYFEKEQCASHNIHIPIVTDKRKKDGS